MSRSPPQGPARPALALCAGVLASCLQLVNSGQAEDRREPARNPPHERQAAPGSPASAPAQAAPAGAAESKPTPASTEATVELLRERLKPFGETIRVPGLGEVWKPRGIAEDWQPYLNGLWRYNERVGWFFVSDEPWAEITNHYGRWFDDPQKGWVWAVGTDWAPAAVEWRRSRTHVGWRPLAPDNAPEPRSKAAKKSDHADDWVFVPIDRLLAERINPFRVPNERLAALIEETRPIGTIGRHRGLALNFALQPEVIRRLAKVQVPSHNLPRPELAPLPESLRDIATEPRPAPGRSK